MLWCYIYGVIPKHRVLADILKGCVFHSGLGFWDMVITSRGKAKKGKEGKPETQGEWKMSLSPEIYRDLKKSHVVEDGHHFTIKPLIFFWLDIGQSMQISISRYSDLVSWWTKNSRKMTLNPEILRITAPPPRGNKSLYGIRVYNFYKMGGGGGGR